MTFCSLMMQQSPPIQLNICRASWISSVKPVKTLDSPSVWRKKVLGQNVDSSLSLIISDNELEVVYHFFHLGSTISDKLLLGSELNKGFGKAATTMSRPTEYGPAISWLDTPRSRCTKLTWWAYFYSAMSLGTSCPPGKKAGCLPLALSPLYSELHVAGQSLQHKSPGVSRSFQHEGTAESKKLTRMKNGRIIRDLFLGEPVKKKRQKGRTQLWYTNVWKKDLKALGHDINIWETLAANRSS